MRKRQMLLLATAGLATLGCDPESFTDALKDSFIQGMILTGFQDPEPDPPELVDVLCDSSDGSSCNEATLRQTLCSVFSRRKQSPGSRIRLWTMGIRVSQTSIVAEAEVPQPQKKKNVKPVPDSEQWIEQTTMRFIASMSDILEQDPPRRTPLAESLTKIGVSESYGLPRTIVAVTDAREYKNGNFECRPPRLQFWFQLLKQNGALSPNSLKGIRVYFIFVMMPEVRGCDVNLAREQHIHELWKEAMKSAGAVFSMTSGVVQFDSQKKEQR